jgi:hypothetical protein
MRKIFNDPTIEKEFKRQGYVILNLFEKSEFDQVKQLYFKLDGVKGTAGTNKNSYELSFFDKNIDEKRKKSDAVYQFLKSKIDSVLDQYSPIMVNLFSKEKDTGEVPIHQNWTFVDEDKYTSVSFWMPLQNVNRTNGTLEVVPGSHKDLAKYRGPSIPWVFDELNTLMKEEYMVPLELNEGQIAVLDDSIIHYSSDNNTEVPRRAIQVILQPNDSPLIHCYKAKNDPANTVNIIEIKPDYFLDFDMWSEPKSNSTLKQVSNHEHKLTELQLLKICHKNLSA